MDPAVISDAWIKGDFAVQALIGVLRGFVQNSAIADFEDYRIQSEIKNKVDELPDDFDRKIIKSILAALQKRNRFIYCFVPDYTNERSDLECVFEQAEKCLIDLILLKSIPNEFDTPNRIEVVTLSNYQRSSFEHRRSLLASDGRTFIGGEHEEYEFLNLYLGKIFRYATRIEFCDKLFGSKFADNYIHTIKIMFKWLGGLPIDQGNCRLIFHCGMPPGYTKKHIQERISSFQSKYLTSTKIEIQFYQSTEDEQCLPHDRFITSDQISLTVGRGMDFLDKKTHKNRDVTIGLKSIDEVSRLLESYTKDIEERVTISGQRAVES
jgi:hypothetical protein